MRGRVPDHRPGPNDLTAALGSNLFELDGVAIGVPDGSNPLKATSVGQTAFLDPLGAGDGHSQLVDGKGLKIHLIPEWNELQRHVAPGSEEALQARDFDFVKVDAKGLGVEGHHGVHAADLKGKALEGHARLLGLLVGRLDPTDDLVVDLGHVVDHDLEVADLPGG